MRFRVILYDMDGAKTRKIRDIIFFAKEGKKSVDLALKQLHGFPFVRQ